MNTELITKTENFLKQKFDNSAYFKDHPDEKAYRLEHSYRVANIGKEIAEKEGFDVTEMVMACLLYDVSYCEDFDDDGWKDHGRNAARIARPFLLELGLPQDRVNDMCYGIAIHVDDEADFEGERTPFALSVGDADNIDRFDAYRIHEGLVYEKFLEKSFEEKVNFVNTRIEKLGKAMQMELGTKTAEEIWTERIAYYIGFYEKLQKQFSNSTAIN
jgi:uncharacterized protein